MVYFKHIFKEIFFSYATILVLQNKHIMHRTIAGLLQDLLENKACSRMGLYWFSV